MYLPKVTGVAVVILVLAPAYALAASVELATPPVWFFQSFDRFNSAATCTAVNLHSSQITLTTQLIFHDDDTLPFPISSGGGEEVEEVLNPGEATALTLAPSSSDDLLARCVFKYRGEADRVKAAIILEDESGNRALIAPADHVSSPACGSEDTTSLPVVAVAASGFEEGNGPENTRDDDLDTRWAAKGDGQWLRYDLGSPQTVNEVRIAWYRGDQRQAHFDIEVSLDATTWTEVFSGSSSGSTLRLECYGLANVTAHYIRIVGHGNTENDWTSITEVEIIGRPN